MRRLPPVGALQAFVHVARQGSLKAAAESLALSSSALTRRIQALEEFVGTALFERQHNALVLTAEGEIFLEEVAPHVDALAAAVERLSGPVRGMRLKVAVPSLFASQRLMPELSSLRDRHPNLQIDVDTGPNRLARLQGDGLDAAIAIADEIDPRLYSRLLEKGRVVAIGSRAIAEGSDALRRAQDLEHVTILLHRDMAGNFEQWRKAAGHPGLEPKAVSLFDSGQLILDAAAEGLGVAFMLDSHLSLSSDDRLVQLFEETVESPYSYWFACQPAALERRAVRNLHDWLFERFAA
ncbi:MAG: LysR substrate-binding domain-containing protein [Pseudomonadota bacterium]|nr:LysR substrate-binding domain-containing protein [Pseudomonadota bacterium]